MDVPDSIKEAREKLPIFVAKDEIIENVRNNRTVVFVGETGCGKTTQIPQYLLESGLAKKKCIAITQPRRVAAVSIAKRVAEEAGTTLGYKVGYSVRFDNTTSAATKIKFLTDGMLLREAILNPLLSDYSIIILDEAHERTVNNDLLFGIVKNAQHLRKEEKLKPLKIIVMSATLDYKRFMDYFNAPAYLIHGREYSIKVNNAEKKQKNYIHSALVTIFQIHQNEPPGDILVFATGEEEIKSLVVDVERVAKALPIGFLKVMACKLYGALPIEKQTESLKPAPPGYRKVIVATNIAETSITIPGIKYVIDTGMVKQKSYNPVSGYDLLTVQRISKAQALQRAGRAGRESNGVCYRLYTVNEYQDFKDYTVPEILRCCLSGAILQMVAIGIKDVKKFDFIDRPSDENIEAAINQLKLLSAIKENDGNLELTEIGNKMVQFPLDPRYAKIIIASESYGCTEDILSIISVLSIDRLFTDYTQKRERFFKIRSNYDPFNHGDLIMYLNIFRAYRKVKGSEKHDWCEKNFINAKNISTAATIKKQLREICVRIGITVNTAGDKTQGIKKALVAGLFQNAVWFIQDKKGPIDKIRTYRALDNGEIVKLHPSSCLYLNQPNNLIYTELVKTTELFMRCVSHVTPEDFFEVMPEYFNKKTYRSMSLPLFEQKYGKGARPGPGGTIVY